MKALVYCRMYYSTVEDKEPGTRLKSEAPVRSGQSSTEPSVSTRRDRIRYSFDQAILKTFRDYIHSDASEDA